MDEGFCINKSRGGAYGGGGGVGIKCGRWNPTAEQVKVLTDLFRSGLRTPSTDQIQRISSQLSCYGKIESKNVFYWFQNHKARERQKRRRISKDEHKENQYDPDKNSSTGCMNMMNGAEEMNQVFEAPRQEKVVETLQLFPLNSFRETPEAGDRKQFRFFAEDWNSSSFSYATNHRAHHIHDHQYHPALDLRLSFMS